MRIEDMLIGEIMEVIFDDYPELSEAELLELAKEMQRRARNYWYTP